MNAEYTEAKMPCLMPHTHTSPESALRLMWTRQEDKSVYAQSDFKMTFGGACIAVWLPAGLLLNPQGAQTNLPGVEV